MYLANVVDSTPNQVGSEPDFNNIGLSILRVYRALMGETLDFDTLFQTSVLATLLYLVGIISVTHAD